MYTLSEVEKYCLQCNKCKLSETRNNVVFGEGNEHAQIMLIGEGPGHNEDNTGKPFVGKAGHLLDKMLDSIQISREEIYITNIVKCHPPDNRNPSTEESDKCINYLRWQVKLIKPKIIVCLGAVSAKKLLRPDFSISKERGIWIEKKGIYFMPTYHPAYLLRNPSAKKFAWEDLKMIKNKSMQL